MGRLASDATLLRGAKRDLRQWQNRAQRAESMLMLEKQRADKAEAECNQWKARFDALLKRDSQ